MTSQREQKQIHRAKAVLDVFKATGGDIAAIEHAALSAKPEDLVQELMKALQVTYDNISKLEAEPATQIQALDSSVKLLNAIAELSPSLKQQMQAANLYLAKTADVARDAHKIREVKRLFAVVMQTAALSAIHNDILNSIRLAQKLSLKATEDYVGELHKSLHRINAPSTDIAASTIKTSNRNMLYDPLKRLGAAIYEACHAIVSHEFEMQRYPDAAAKFTHSPVLEGEENFRNMNMLRNGTPFA